MGDTVKLSAFLGPKWSSKALAFAQCGEAALAPARIGLGDGEINELVRRSLRTRELGEIGSVIEDAVLAAVPALIVELGITPFDVSSCEIEMVAHGDNGFYRRHIDTFTGDGRAHAEDRILSCVYYFHAMPKKFTGGALRLYPRPTSKSSSNSWVDIEPEHDSLVAFSSWLPHEVMPVACPSKRHEDSRFTVNCWVYRARPQSAPNAA